MRVIKLGGSLLDCPDLASRMRGWLALQSPACNVLIVGGGALVDAIRQADSTHGLGQEACHWLSIRAMGITARIVAAILPEAELVDELAMIKNRGGTFILDPWQFLQAVESGPAADRLPHHWDVTSDSIAAHLADRLQADELVLLKSDLPENGRTVESAAHDGYVDPYLPVAARRLEQVRCVDLRQSGFPEVLLTRDGVAGGGSGGQTNWTALR